jgi:hypothetical protein
MTISTASARDRAIVLRRQRARTIAGQPHGGYTNTFEIICRDCGDDPRLNYQDVSPRLQRIRGPYWIGPGVTEYEAHIAWHETPAHAR